MTIWLDPDDLRQFSPAAFGRSRGAIAPRTCLRWRRVSQNEIPRTEAGKATRSVVREARRAKS